MNLNPRHVAIFKVWICWGWALYLHNLWSLPLIAAGFIIYFLANSQE